MIKIAPSILAANFSKLAEEVREVDQAGAGLIHIDVMDGHFVPNITMGPIVVEALRPVTKLPLDVHLMIENPDAYIPAFIEAGASIITVHQETCSHLHRTIQLIKDGGAKAGVVINPATPVEFIKEVLPIVDMVLVMTVNPGFGGQSFIYEALPKVSTLNQWRQENDYHYEIEIDGGVNVDTAKLCTDNGADVLVAGSAIFNKANRDQAIKDIRDSISK